MCLIEDGKTHTIPKSCHLSRDKNRTSIVPQRTTASVSASGGNSGKMSSTTIMEMSLSTDVWINIQGLFVVAVDNYHVLHESANDRLGMNNLKWSLQVEKSTSGDPGIPNKESETCSRWFRKVDLVKLSLFNLSIWYVHIYLYYRHWCCLFNPQPFILKRPNISSCRKRNLW
jgi:hypothetical protein